VCPLHLDQKAFAFGRDFQGKALGCIFVGIEYDVLLAVLVLHKLDLALGPSDDFTLSIGHWSLLEREDDSNKVEVQLCTHEGLREGPLLGPYPELQEAQEADHFEGPSYIENQ